MSRVRQIVLRLVCAGALCGGALTPVLVSGGGTALAADCVKTDAGFTAAVVATSGQAITGTIDATGCDLGVYVGPGVTGVLVRGATISHAVRHAILVQNTGGVTISQNTVTANEPNGETSDESKAIQLEGTHGVVVSQNTVTHNKGGGISVLDDGPATPDGLSGSVVPSVGNVITQNVVTDNSGGCGIVVAAYSKGGGVSANRVVGNTVDRNPAGIVVAADAPGTTAMDNRVVNNTTSGNGAAGIIVHSNAPGDAVWDTTIVNNTVSGNLSGLGILVEIPTPTQSASPAASLWGTTVVANRICDQAVPILRNGDYGTRVGATRAC